MFNENKIRPLAVAIIKHNKKFLVGAHFDSVANIRFYRLVGGGVEFGEKIEEALHREIKEELNSEIVNVKYLGMLENIFEFEGNHGHELVFVYQGDLTNESLFNQPVIKIIDSHNGAQAFWVTASELKNSHFYPQGIIKYIDNLN